MEYLDNWGDAILPSDKFLVGDVWQLFVIAAVLVLASRFLRVRSDPKQAERTSPRLWIERNLGFIVTWTLITVTTLIFSATGLSDSFFQFFAFLGGLWIIVGLLCSLLHERFWSRSVAFAIYIVTGLNAISYSEGSLQAIKHVQFGIGSLKISVWDVATGILAFALALWISLGIARLIEKQVQGQRRLSPSLRVLIVKIIRITFIIAAAMIALSSMGIDLTSLTVLGGAIGLGLGFGLQKVVSNFVSGIILLLDNSIKPGDVIEIEGTYGWINHLRARYASVITRDGTEHLIPNEDLITQRVINWSFTDELVRMRATIGVSYNADPHECIRLITAAAATNERILREPAPVCYLKEFGDSSINLELRFWLRDPANGVASVKSHVLLKVWDSFKEHGIEIPFPQRDLHIRSSDVDFVQRDAPNPD
ncbi:mechanosensitive ion channel family protein [Coraliomargarita sp. W4R53]